jgi:receptor-type tyrosine-protein phosphatase F
MNKTRSSFHIKKITKINLFPVILISTIDFHFQQGKYECVAENTIGTEHSKPINLYVKIRRVPPQFSRPPDPVNEVLLGGNLNLTCVAVGSPMPFVKWRRGLDEDITPENELPVGKSVLELNDIRSSANYTCIASSSLGVIEALAMVKVQCKNLT